MRRILKTLTCIIPTLAVYAQTGSIDYYIHPDEKNWKLGTEHVSSLPVSEMFAPLVGDLDGDGIPEIVTTKETDKDENTASLIVLQGDDLTQATEISLKGYTDYYSGTNCGLVRVVNPDDKTDTAGLIFVRTNKGLYSYRYKGENEISLFKKFTMTVPSGTIGFADFNEDGNTEAYIGGMVFNAWTLNLTGSASEAAGAAYFHNTVERVSFAADVLPDEDGTELICGNYIYKVTATGINLLKTITPPDGVSEDGQVAVADFDADGLPDVLVKARMTKYIIYAYNPRSGDILFSGTVDGVANRYFNYPSVGDVNGDGSPDIITSSKGKIRITGYDINSASISEEALFTHTDIYGSSGICLYDFNRDGKVELVFHDYDSLMILNASLQSHLTGADTVIYPLATVPFAAEPEVSFPVVVDCNADSIPDILVAGSAENDDASYLYHWNAYLPGFERTARPARQLWNRYAYNAVNIDDNLLVPADRENPCTWQPDGETSYNACMQQVKYANPREDESGEPWPDLLFAEEPVLMYTEGADSATFTLTITNRGEGTFENPLYISIYWENTETKLQTATIYNSIAAGDTVTLTVTFPVTTNIIDYIIQLNDRGREYTAYIFRPETDVDNNTAYYSADTTLFSPDYPLNVLSADTGICPGEIVTLAVEQKSDFSYSWYGSTTSLDAYENKNYETNYETGTAPADSGASQLLTLFSDKDKTFWVQARRNDTLFTRVPVTLYYDQGNCLDRDTIMPEGESVWKEDFGGNDTADDFSVICDGFPDMVCCVTTDGYFATTDGKYHPEASPFHFYGASCYNVFYSIRKKVSQGGGTKYLSPDYYKNLCNSDRYLSTKVGDPFRDRFNTGYGVEKEEGVFLNMDDHTIPDNPEQGYFLWIKDFDSLLCNKNNILLPGKKTYCLSVWATNVFSGTINRTLKLSVTGADGTEIASESWKIPDNDPVWKLYKLMFTIDSTQEVTIHVSQKKKSAWYFFNWPLTIAIDDIEITERKKLPDLVSLNGESACLNDSLILAACFENDGSFLFDTLVYRWQFSPDNNTWNVLDEGLLTEFTDSSNFYDTLIIAPAREEHSGRYRFIIGSPETIDCDTEYRASDTLYFVVNLPDSVSRDTIYCEGTEMIFDDISVDASGEYMQHLQKELTGCDSIITWLVTAYPSYRISADTIVCDAAGFSLADTIITRSGTYTEYTYCKYSGCDSIITWQVPVQPSTMEISGATDICDNRAATYTYTRKQGLDESVYYNWSVTGEAQTVDFGDSIQVVWPLYGNKTVVLHAHNTDCMDSVNYPVTVHKSPEADFYARPEDSLTNDDFHIQSPIVFDNISYLYTSDEIDNTDLNYEWNFGNGSTADSFEPETEYEALGIYTIRLIATEPEWGCSDTCSLNIEVVNFDEAAAAVPTAFTPNGDGHNDVFMIRGWRLSELHYFKIYNRWGQVIFETSSLSDGWDGTLKNIPQATGTYIYMFEVFDDAGNSITKKGYFDLLR